MLYHKWAIDWLELLLQLSNEVLFLMEKDNYGFKSYDFVIRMEQDSEIFI